MAIFKAFRAVRPIPEYAAQVAALPYDVMSSDEAREMVRGNPYSFLHVDKAEIDLPPDCDLYSDAVYAKAKENLLALQHEGVCRKDETPCLYIYRQIMNGRSQTGLAGCASIDDYLNSAIKKHEKTRADKEQDRIRHVDTLDANTGPIFLTYRPDARIATLTKDWQAKNTPEYDFTDGQGVRQTIWVVDDVNTITALQNAFASVQSLYIADGHHRAASAVRVGQMRRATNPDYNGQEEFNFFLAVALAADELAIMDYNRLIRDMSGFSVKELLDKISVNFKIDALPAGTQGRPEKAHSFGMYLDDSWYCLTAKKGTYPENDPVASLDVSILQNNLIAPILSIADPRTDTRIDFVGGIRGLEELERRVKTDMQIAFALFPTTLEELMTIADAGEVMPPKSTWFEPKLLSGLFIHELS